MKQAITGEDVWMQLERAGIAAYLTAPRLESKSVYAQAAITIIVTLQTHPSFKQGLFHGLHPDVGDHRTDFRGFRKEFGPGSLQIVVDKRTGKLYADIDSFSPYDDLVGFFGHTGEVIGGWFRRKPKHALALGNYRQESHMSWLSNPLISKLLGSGVRAALAALGGWLVAHGYAQTGQVNSLMLELSPILLALVLSGLEKIKTQATIEVARTAPSDTTKSELAAEVKAMPFTEKVEKASTSASTSADPPAPPSPPGEWPGKRDEDDDAA